MTLFAGEVHLETVIKDLKERFARIQLQVSPPLVAFRESVFLQSESPEAIVKQTHPLPVLVLALLLVSWLTLINTAQSVCSSSDLAAQQVVTLHSCHAGVQIPGGLVDRHQPSPVHPSRPGMGQRVGYPPLHHECCPHC